MREEETLFAVGWHKGEMDFSVRASVQSLSYENMRSLREMIVVGIGVMEQMWGDARAKEQAAQQDFNVPKEQLDAELRRLKAMDGGTE